MTGTPNIARLAALIGDPARALMLVALMRGGARTVSELGAEAGVGLPTASAHLARLAEGGLTRARKSGRHSYVELASPAVAQLLEQMMGLAAAQSAPSSPHRRIGPRDAGLRAARVCYNHLAGRRGVQIHASLIARHHLAPAAEGLVLTPAGRAFALSFGIPAEVLDARAPPLCRECLDWSERRSHLAGRLGRALLARIEENGWARRCPDSRALLFTPQGLRAFNAAFPPAFPPDAALDALDAAGDSP